MTRQSQKDSERRHLDKLMNILDITYDVISDDQERPDFIIKIDDRIIAVEVTERYRHLDEQKNSAELQDALIKLGDNVIDLFKKNKGPPLHFCFSLTGTKSLTKKREFAKNLCDLLLKYSKDENIFQKPFPYLIKIEDYPEYELLKAHLISIAVGKSKYGTPTHTTISDFDTIDASTNHIDSAILDKNNKIYSYPTYEKWLLIALPEMTMSGDLRSPNAALTTINRLSAPMP